MKSVVIFQEFIVMHAIFLDFTILHKFFWCAAGAVRRAVVDKEGVCAARHRCLYFAAACAPPLCR